MKRSIGLALILLLVLTLAVALSGAINLGFGKKLLTQLASNTLERELRIDGEFTLRLGKTPSVAATDIVIANPEWADGDFLRVRRFALTLDLTSLWQRPIIIEYLAIDGADISLVQRKDGSNNWTFGAASEETEEDAPGLQLPVLVAEGSITDSSVFLMKPNLDNPAELSLVKATTRIEEAQHLQLALQGQLGHLPIELNAQAGDYAALRSGENIALISDLKLGNYQLELSGHFGSLRELKNIQANAHLTGRDATPLYEALNFRQPDSGPVDLRASIDDPSSGMNWSLEGQFGSLKADINGSLGDPLALDGLQSSFAVSGDNLHLIANWLGVYTLPEAPFDLRGAVSRNGSDMVIDGLNLQVGEAILRVDATVPAFPSSRDARAVAGIEGPSFARFREFLGLHGVVDVPFKLDVVLQKRSVGLEVLDSDLRIGAMHLKLDGPLGEYPNWTDSELNFQLEGDSLAKLLAELDVQDGPEIPYVATGTLRRGAGEALELVDSLAEVAGMSVRVEGVINDLATLEDNRFTLHLDTASLDGSMAALGYTGFPAQPASLDATISGPLATPAIDELSLLLGDAWLRMEGKLQGFPHLDGSRATLEGEFPDSVQWLPAQLKLPLTFSANLTGAEQQIWLDGLYLESRDWHLKGEAHLSDLPGPRGAVQLLISGPRLAGLLPGFQGFSFAGTPFHLEADISHGDHQLTVNKLKLDAGENSLSAQGSLSESGEGEVAIAIEGQSLASMGRLEGGLLPDKPYTVTAQLGREGQLWSIDELAVRLDQDELTGTASYLGGERPLYRAQLSSQRFNVGQFVDRLEEKEQKNTASKPAQRDPHALLIPNTPLELDWMDGFDAELELDLAGLGIRDDNFEELIALDALRLSATLKAGTLHVPQFQLIGDRGELLLPATLIWTDGTLQADLAMRSEKLKLSLLSKSYDVEGIPVQRVRSRLLAKGATLHQMAASLQGYLLLESGPGRNTNSNLDRMFDSFTTQVLETVNPFFKKDPYTELECGVVGIEFDQGTAMLDPGAIFRTSKIDMMTTGNIQLDTEALHLNIATKARKGLGISAASLVTPFLEVGGTLAKPKIGIDKTGAAVTGGVAAATGGLSILASSLWSRYMDKSDPCEEASNKAQKRLDETGAEAQGP